MLNVESEKCAVSFSKICNSSFLIFLWYLLYVVCMSQKDDVADYRHLFYFGKYLDLVIISLLCAQSNRSMFSSLQEAVLAVLVEVSEQDFVYLSSLVMLESDFQCVRNDTHVSQVSKQWTKISSLGRGPIVMYGDMT